MFFLETKSVPNHRPRRQVVMIRKNFGVAGAGHFAPDNYVLAWPSVESGALPIEGGVAVAFRREIVSKLPLVYP